MFKEDGNVIHFGAPRGMVILMMLFLAKANTSSIVQASVPSNTFAIYGKAEEKEITELVPGIISQLGPESIATLRKLAEQMSAQGGAAEGGAAAEGKADEADDDDVPDLVENFDEPEGAKA